MEHVKKIWPEYFQEVQSGMKKHEVRRLAPGEPEFRVGDTIRLREFIPGPGTYTGQEIAVKVTYVTDPVVWGLPEDVRVMSIRPV